MATKKLLGLEGGISATIGTADVGTIGGNLDVSGNASVLRTRFGAYKIIE